MKKLACIFLLAVMLVNCIFVSMPVYAAFEASQTSTAIADAYYNSYPSDYKGTDSNLMITQIGSSQAVARTTFFKFDLTDIKANIAAGGAISKAIVKLTVQKTNTYTGSAKLSLFKFDDDTWTEDGTVKPTPIASADTGTLTVSTDPNNTANNYVSIPAGITNTQVELDITSHLITEAAKANDNYLSLEAGYRNEWLGSGTYYLYSREYSTASYHPQLYVEFTEAVVPEPVVKEFKVNDVSLAKAGPLTEVTEITVAQGTAQYAESLSSAGDLRLKNAIISEIANGDTTFSVKFNLKEENNVTKTFSFRGNEHAKYNQSVALRINYSDSTSEDLIPVMTAKAEHANPETINATVGTMYLGRNATDDGSVESRVAFAKFDLSSLSSKTSSISSAQIVMKNSISGGSDSNYLIGVYKIYDDEWTSATLCWNNMPNTSEMISLSNLESGNIKVTAEVSNTLDASKTFNAILAVYKVDASGKYALAGVRLNPVTLASGESKKISSNFELAELADGESYVGKVMVLDGIATLVPLLSVTNY